ncbi:MAG: DUF2061 domain-containing protein [Rhodospirillales bacterium]
MPRKLIKTGTYSVMHLVVAVTVAYALTRDWQIALGVGIIEPMVQTVAYTFHESVWSWIAEHRGKGGAGIPPPSGKVPAAA